MHPDDLIFAEDPHEAPISEKEAALWDAEIDRAKRALMLGQLAMANEREQACQRTFVYM